MVPVGGSPEPTWPYGSGGTAGQLGKEMAPKPALANIVLAGISKSSGANSVSIGLKLASILENLAKYGF